jgi:YgiT-type zinc finger domain-containing protein
MNKFVYDDCHVCGGKVEAKLVRKACSWGNRLVAIISAVPAGVCVQCSERYYQAHVLKHIEKQLRGLDANSKRIEIPEARFAA